MITEFLYFIEIYICKSEFECKYLLSLCIDVKWNEIITYLKQG